MKVVNLAVACARRDEQIRSEVGFELATRPGVVEIALRAPDGSLVRALLDPEAAKDLGADIVAAALDAEEPTG